MRSNAYKEGGRRFMSVNERLYLTIQPPAAEAH